MGALLYWPPLPLGPFPLAPHAYGDKHVMLLKELEFRLKNSRFIRTLQAKIHILLQLLFKNNRVSWLQGDDYGSECKLSSKTNLYRRGMVYLFCNADPLL